MMPIILIVILMQLTGPAPTMVNTPVPHWDCPAPFQPTTETTPHCRTIFNPTRELFDPTKEEPIFWTWSGTYDSNGMFNKPYPTGMRNVSCQVAGKHRALLNKNTGLQLKGGTPGASVSVNCQGILKR